MRADGEDVFLPPPGYGDEEQGPTTSARLEELSASRGAERKSSQMFDDTVRRGRRTVFSIERTWDKNHRAQAAEQFVAQILLDEVNAQDDSPVRVWIRRNAPWLIMSTKEKCDVVRAAIIVSVATASVLAYAVVWVIACYILHATGTWALLWRANPDGTANAD